MRHEHAPHTQWHMRLINPQKKNWIQDAMSHESKEPIFPQIGGASRKEYGTLLDICLRVTVPQNHPRYPLEACTVLWYHAGIAWAAALAEVSHNRVALGPMEYTGTRA
ncbi:hypothetical protein NDU88_012326 [Pleurodeles waltl]|uniref:Uncharacterized protein n=1 Tax=Pleurodeles waltl TaxID=8319 RepID=A0AAV7R4B1_PLEWA|nr:hypothetical protein NDU88_012326 [Pleurodeles waltl]